MAEDIYEGHRLSYEGNLCTVRYIGEVANTKGKWLGVEWDDPSRGKHDGSHNGTKYFSCQSESPLAASFVRPNRPHEDPVGFVTAIRNKYGSQSLKADAPIGVEEAQTIRISGKEVEEVGFQKVRLQLANLKDLRIVLLDHLCLARPVARSASRAKGYASDVTDNNDVESTCPRVLELDMSGNLFEEWDEIIDICRQLPALTSLRADRNRFRTVRSSRFDRFLSNPPFTRMKTLTLDDTLLRWADICALAESFPSLASLSAAGNELRVLSDLHFSPRITSLSLERNNIISLHDLLPLMYMKSLRKLNLKGNSINSIRAQSTISNEPMVQMIFPSSINDVDLSYNEIKDWRFIDSLSHTFPGLTALRVSGNPLYANLQAADGKRLSADDGYMLTLARLGNITRLNFSQITEKERRNAEIYYLSQIGQELSRAPESDRDAIQLKHVRFGDLCSIYGEPAVTSRKPQTIDPSSLAAKLTKFSFHFDDAILAAASKTGRSGFEKDMELEIPRSLTIYSIQGIVGKRIGVSPMLLKLVWITGEEDFIHNADDDSDDDQHGTDFDGMRKERTKLREEVLVPRTRPIGTWIDENKANVRIELSEPDVARNAEAKKGLSVSPRA